MLIVAAIKLAVIDYGHGSKTDDPLADLDREADKFALAQKGLLDSDNYSKRKLILVVLMCKESMFLVCISCVCLICRFVNVFLLFMYYLSHFISLYFLGIILDLSSGHTV